MKSADVGVFTRLKDGKLLIGLGPRKVAHLLLKYLSADASPRLYLVRLTKLVDKYDLGKSFQVRVNHERDTLLLSNTTQQLFTILPDDATIHTRFDPGKPFSVSRPGEMFSETTKVWPPKLIVRKPDGTLGSLAQDKLLKIAEAKEFQVFEYADPDRHFLKRVTRLVAEPVYEAPRIFKVPLQGTVEGKLLVESPAERDVFDVKCQHTSLAQVGLTLEVVSITPDRKLNEPGAPIRHWRAHFRLKQEGECPEPGETKDISLAFIDATPVQRELQKVFARHLIQVQVGEPTSSEALPISSRPGSSARIISARSLGTGRGEASARELASNPSAASLRRVKGPTEVILDEPGAKTIVHEYLVPGVRGDKERTLELTSSRPRLLTIMGPSKRVCKSGDSLNLKLMFINQQDKRRTSNKPIQIMIFVAEE